jgi:hypothetical protein
MVNLVGPAVSTGALATYSQGRQTSAFKVEPLGDLPPVQWMDWNRMLSDEAPPVLWAARSMASHSTGMRPDGEAVKLHGTWWKLEPLSDARIRADMALNAMSFGVDTYVDATWLKKAVEPRVALQKALHDAIRAGVSRSEMIDMIDNKIVVSVMTD